MEDTIGASYQYDHEQEPVPVASRSRWCARYEQAKEVKRHRISRTGVLVPAAVEAPNAGAGSAADADTAE